ncbi:hypothetical protein [Rhodopseudomonas sp. RCAM05734]|uniref:hypothetical protein n=1 Tax=Rhodopseudomonas sp. RCAM05734 TaxID=3457549 RepID=UPI004044B620
MIVAITIGTQPAGQFPVWNVDYSLHGVIRRHRVVAQEAIGARRLACLELAIPFKLD